MSPELLVLLLTTRCNLACKYCYLACGQEGEDMPWEVFRAVLARLRITPREVILSGGEPTLVPDLLRRIVKALRERFPRLRLSLQTNGTLLEPKLIEFLQVFRVGLGVSLDGPPEINEALRGGTGAVVKGLRLLADQGLACGVTVTVTWANARRLGETVLFLGQFSAVASFGLDILRPVGRGQREDLPPKADLRVGLIRAQEALFWLAAHGRTLVFREAQRRKEKGSYCPAQRGTALVITPNGDAYPCASLVGQERFFMGNIGNGELLPKKLPDPCGTCIFRETCPGRCPSRALLSPEAASLDCLVREALGFHKRTSSKRFERYVSGPKIDGALSWS